MKKFLLVSLSALSGAGLAIALLGLPLTVRAGGAQGIPPADMACGDVNHSGKVDLSDAVAILQLLFTGERSQLDCRGGPLQATGQTTCYDQSGAVIDCASATCPGQDGRYQTGCPSEGRFVDNKNGTVMDTCTGLIWQKDAADVTGDGRTDLSDRLRWCEALDYCEKLNFAGHDDWRLPNILELQSIVDYANVPGSIDPIFKPPVGTCWSSTTIAKMPSCAWTVVFSDPAGCFCDKAYAFSVRAVRNAP